MGPKVSRSSLKSLKEEMNLKHIERKAVEFVTADPRRVAMNIAIFDAPIGGLARVGKMKRERELMK